MVGRQTRWWRDEEEERCSREAILPRFFAPHDTFASSFPFLLRFPALAPLCGHWARLGEGALWGQAMWPTCLWLKSAPPQNRGGTEMLRLRSSTKAASIKAGVCRGGLFTVRNWSCSRTSMQHHRKDTSYVGEKKKRRSVVWCAWAQDCNWRRGRPSGASSRPHNEEGCRSM